MSKKVIFHVPHSSVDIPGKYRDQFIVDDRRLAEIAEESSDFLTKELYTCSDFDVDYLVAPISRIVCDVERFVDDRMEPMSSHGLGVVYRKSFDGVVIRRELTETEKQSIIKDVYNPHHARLESMVRKAIDGFGSCLIVDCHSYAASPHRYESLLLERPQICIGTCIYHTPKKLAEELLSLAHDHGYSACLNQPFSGSIVPKIYHLSDARVRSVMLEARKDIYISDGFMNDIGLKKFQNFLMKVVAMASSY